MRLCSFLIDGQSHAGLARSDDTVIDLTAYAREAGEAMPESVLGWVMSGPDAIKVLADIDVSVGARHIMGPVDELTLQAPFARPPRNVICVGANYRDHIVESERVVGDLNLPPDPVYFTKDVRSICGPYDDIPVDEAVTSQLDWEVELAVVIGQRGRSVRAEQAMDLVFGYAVLNDVSARDVQLTRNQWWKGKSLEHSSPFGPFVVTADEVDPTDLELSCRVDGIEKQRASSSELIHLIPDLIADLSTTLTLEPGDVISTGTPDGVGLARSPQEWLRPGCVLESEISGLGRQRNLIVKSGV